MDEDEAAISRQLAEVHRSGQERLGLTVALIAFFAWLEANQDADSPGLTKQAADEILDIAQRARSISYRLSARYYNLARAVSTGYALPDVGHQFAAGRTTLQQVYGAMAETLNEVNELADLDFDSHDVSDDELPRAGESGDKSMEERLDDLEDAIVDLFRDTIPEDDIDVIVEEIEDWDWPEFDEDDADHDLIAELEELEKEQQERADEIRRAEKLYQQTLDELERLARTEAAKAAGEVWQNTLKPGRNLIDGLGAVDGRRLAWMRVTGPTPCAFCSMLASRGAVYKSQRSALFDAYGRLYHPNCACYVIPIFTDDPSYSERDRYFMDNWGQVTNGYSGRAALNAWRRWLRKQYAAGLVPDQDTYGPARPA